MRILQIIGKIIYKILQIIGKIIYYITFATLAPYEFWRYILKKRHLW